MPHWKIKGYKFSFKKGEVLKKYEPAHIHVKTERGEIEFWLVPPNTKITDEISIKAENKRVPEIEKSEIEKIVRERRDEFLNKWNSIKEREVKGKGKQVESSSSSSDSENGSSGSKGVNPSLNLKLNPVLKEQNLIQLETQESLLLQESENSSSLSNSQENESFSSSFPSSLLEVAPVVLAVVFLFMGKFNYNQNFNYHYR